MHRLHLLRHAKSSWDEGVDDRERKLNRRGREEAERVGEHLPAAIGRLDLVLCSSARRARETMTLALAQFDPAPRILIEDGLYLAGAGAIAEPAVASSTRRSGFGFADRAQSRPARAGGRRSPPRIRRAYAALAGGKFPTAVRASFAIEGELGRASGTTRHRLTDYVTAKSLKD